MELHEGDRVILKSPEGGTLVGRVVAVTHHLAVIVPVEDALKAWIPNGLVVDEAHWSSRIEVLPPLPAR